MISRTYTRPYSIFLFWMLYGMTNILKTGYNRLLNSLRSYYFWIKVSDTLIITRIMVNNTYKKINVEVTYILFTVYVCIQEKSMLLLIPYRKVFRGFTIFFPLINNTNTFPIYYRRKHIQQIKTQRSIPIGRLSRVVLRVKFFKEQ